MSHSTDYQEARQRAEAKYGFYVHAVVYGAVMLLLIVINLVTSPGVYWFIWPLMGWGLAVVLHGAGVYLWGGKSRIVDDMTERELQRSGARRPGEHS